MTVKELCDLLANVPPNTPVYTSVFGSSENGTPLVEVYDDHIYIWSEEDANVSREC